jgi:CubicO group peptidase (beta-lactamase class C family)
MKCVRLLFFSFFIFKLSFGQTWQDTLSLLDKAFSQYQPENPGCQLSVSRNGQIIFSKAWGMEDLERHVPLSNNSIIEAGSVSKQFTAAAILLLAQQGMLSLDDDIRKYIPEMPDYGTAITIRQLLHHSSGLRDWGSVADLTGWPRGKKFYTNEDALEIIVRQKHLNYKPGEEYLYSNSNYNVLSIIIQRVSGLTLAAFTKKYIFEPAGMTHTQWRDDPNRIVPNRAIAYSRTDNRFETDMPNEYVYGHGGLLTTTEDLLKWCNFYQQGRLGNPSLLPEQLRLEFLNNGELNPYAAGLFIKKVDGWNSISHDGATAGYRAYLETFPDLSLSFAILSNSSQFNMNNVATGVRKIFVPDKREQSIKNVGHINLVEVDVRGFTGLYLNARDGSTFQLSEKGGNLILDNDLPLTAISRNKFKAANFHLELYGTQGLYIPNSPRDTIPFSMVKQIDLSKLDVHPYEGNYFSEETNSSVQVKTDNGNLIIQLNDHVSYSLIPTYADAFKINEIDCDLRFIRGSQNKIVGIKMSVPRARGVEFEKSN